MAVVLPRNDKDAAQRARRSVGQSVMKSESMVGTSCQLLLIFALAVIAGAQTPATEGPSLSSRGSEKYWLVVDEFADRAVHAAYAQRFVQLHEGSLTARQCQQYSMIAFDYRDELAAAKQAGVSAQSEFWNDVRAYAISMMGAPGVPIPIHRTSKYLVTTGSEAEDRELRRLVLLEIDNASSQLMLTGGYSSSPLKTGCLPAVQDPTIKAQR